MKKLAVFGASGHGKVVADAAEKCGWKTIVFFDDAWPTLESNGPWEVCGDTDTLLANLTAFDGIIVSIGNNTTRSRKQIQLMDNGANIVSVIHPSAIVSTYATVGEGTVIFANAVVNASAKVGVGVIINTGSVVEHDCAMGDFSHISPNAVLSGGVIAGKRSWIGAGASVRQMVQIGDAAIVGMGAVVIKNVPAGATVIGSPAKTQP